MSNIYSIQLLNDIHNYFPDILYNTNRFRNVQDLLEYIRQVAQINPYDRGLNMYNSQNYDRISDIARIFIPVSRNPVRSIFSEILSEFMTENIEDVVIQPTNEQIINATTVYPVNTLQDDICIICQDNIEVGDVRRITHCGHYFHKLCIDTWFQRNIHCPTCRYDIRS